MDKMNPRENEIIHEEIVRRRRYAGVKLLPILEEFYNTEADATHEAAAEQNGGSVPAANARHAHGRGHKPGT